MKKIFRDQSHFLKNAFTVKISYEKFSVVRVTMRTPTLKYNTLTKFPAVSIKGYRIIFLSLFKWLIQIAQPFMRQLHKMAKHTQTIRRLLADEWFECVWPLCGVGA